jgi:hypothetical protein
MASTTMQSEAPIRRVEKEDVKFVRFMVGQANMELLVVANRSGIATYVYALKVF